MHENNLALVKTQCCPKSTLSVGLGWGSNAILTSFRVMLKLQVLGLPSENHWPKLWMIYHQHNRNQAFGQDTCKPRRTEECLGRMLINAPYYIKTSTSASWSSSVTFKDSTSSLRKSPLSLSFRACLCSFSCLLRKAFCCNFRCLDRFCESEQSKVSKV